MPGHAQQVRPRHVLPGLVRQALTDTEASVWPAVASHCGFLDQ